jgi:hypothetical protein
LSTYEWFGQKHRITHNKQKEMIENLLHKHEISLTLPDVFHICCKHFKHGHDKNAHRASRLEDQWNSDGGIWLHTEKEGSRSTMSSRGTIKRKHLEEEEDLEDSYEVKREGDNEDMTNTVARRKRTRNSPRQVDIREYDNLLDTVERLQQEISSLKERNECLEGQVDSLKKRLEAKAFVTYENVCRDPKLFKVYTGPIGVRHFDYLLGFVQKEYKSVTKQECLFLTLLFGHFCRNLSKISVMTGYPISGLRKWIQETASDVAKGVREIHLKFPDENVLETETVGAVNFEEAPEAWKFRRMLIPDGTGVKVLRSSDDAYGRRLWVHYKGENQLRKQAVVTPRGRVVYVTQFKYGQKNDLETIQESSFNDMLSAAYSLDRFNERKMGMDAADLGDEFLVFGADKGYPRFVPAAGVTVMCTESAKYEYEPQELRGRPWLKLDKHLAKYRSVVERVFGNIQQYFPTVRGPVYLSQGDLINDLWDIAACMLNRELDSRIERFKRTSSQVDNRFDEYPDSSDDAQSFARCYFYHFLETPQAPAWTSPREPPFLNVVSLYR